MSPGRLERRKDGTEALDYQSTETRNKRRRKRRRKKKNEKQHNAARITTNLDARVNGVANAVVDKLVLIETLHEQIAVAAHVLDHLESDTQENDEVRKKQSAPAPAKKPRCSCSSKQSAQRRIPC